MGYEIPQELEYQEKIMFGLTFKQLIYAFIFGSISALILKANGSIYLRVIFAMIPLTTALGFMFLDFETYIKNWWVWNKFRRSNIDDPKMRSYVEVENIENDFILTKNNKKIAVLKVTPINFAIKTIDEQGAISKAFQKFLNSIDFPVQIVMSTDELDLKSYTEAIDKNISKKYSKLLEDYKDSLKNTISNNKIMNRTFYLIIPEKTNIDIQITICEDKFRNLGLKTRRLINSELKELLARFFNGKREEKEQNEEEKKKEKEENAKLTRAERKNKKQEKKKEELFRFIAPEQLENKKDYLQIGTVFNRIVCAYGYPRHVEAGFLDKVISSLGNFDLSMHISPYPIETMLIGLNRELQKQRADLYAEESKGIVNPSLEIKYRDTRNILEELQKGKEKLFNVSLYINCKTKTEDYLAEAEEELIKQKLEEIKELEEEQEKVFSKKKKEKILKITEKDKEIIALNAPKIARRELDLLTKKVESELNALMIIPSLPKLRMAQGLKSIVPLGVDELKVTRNITTDALSAFFPFTSPFLHIDKEGVCFGLNKNNIPIIRDVFKLSNPNGTILATSGAGKSYLSKLFIARNLLNGVKVMVIDPQGEYDSLVKHFKGQAVEISRDSKTMINPFDLVGHNYADKRLSLMDTMGLMFGNLTDPQRAFIDKAISMIYEERGITNKPKTWKREPPIMFDLLDALKRLEKKVTVREKVTLRSLINRAEMYVSGVFSFMNKQTKINFDNSFVSFNIKDMPKQVKPVMMFLILDYVYMKMREGFGKKILVIDEAWSLLSRAEEASYIFEIVKTSRKFNLGLLLINQEVEGLLTSSAGRSALANSAYTLLLRQKPAVIKNITQTFNLSDVEKDRLLTAGPGEGILILDNEHSEIKVVASPEEHKLITTNPNERFEENQIRNNTPKIKKKSKTKTKKIKGKKESKRSIRKSNKKVKSNIKPKKEELKEPAKIRVNEWGRFYKKADLAKIDIDYLLNKGYKESRHVSISDTSHESYLLKPRSNESLEHLFLIFNIASHLKNYTDKVEIFETTKPDIVFEINGKKCAIEVETGDSYQKSKDKLCKKVSVLNKVYGKRWFFVLTDKYFKKKYQKLGPVLLRKDVVPCLKNWLPKKKA